MSNSLNWRLTRKRHGKSHTAESTCDVVDEERWIQIDDGQGGILGKIQDRNRRINKWLGGKNSLIAASLMLAVTFTCLGLPITSTIGVAPYAFSAVHKQGSLAKGSTTTPRLEKREHQTSTPIPVSEATGSVELLLQEAQRKRLIFDAEINPEYEAERCAQYDFGYDGRLDRRNLFWGSNVADESWHVFGSVAMEAFGIFHTVAFIESNRTHTFDKRQLRFLPMSDELHMLQSGIYGPSTKVTVDYFEDEVYSEGLVRDNLQRDMILRRWKMNGMKATDVGIIGDSDEIFTRDFLRALQICDIPTFRPGQDCKSPKVVASTLVFESSPECIRKGGLWFHPDAILGACVDGIGDPQNRPTPLRVHEGNKAWRKKGYHSKYPAMPNTTTAFPLWNAADFRMTPGGSKYNKETHTGFHFHNFFVSVNSMRQKYKTYAHPIQGALELPLGSIGPDLDFMVDCVMNRPEDGNEYPRKLGGSKSIKGPLPLAFQFELYTQARHDELRDQVIADEIVHPSNTT